MLTTQLFPRKGGEKGASAEWGGEDGGGAESGESWGKGGDGKDSYGKGGKDKGKGKGKDSWGGGGWGKYGGGKDWGKGGGKDWWGSGGGALGPGGGWGGGSGDWIPEQTGYVKAWHEDRGFGFVTVSSGDDIYVHRTVLTDGDALTIGGEVWIEAQWDYPKGKWCATRCAGASAKGAGKAGQGVVIDPDMAKGKGKGKGKGSGKMGADWMTGMSAWVKTWNEERGFGFVTTESGEDVYCHRTVLDGSFLELKAEVVVDAKWLWDKNKWQALKLAGASGPPPAVAGIDKPVALGEQGGLIKAWNARGFGFIVPDNGGADVYVHKSALTDGYAELPVGCVVMFDLQFDLKTNKYIAQSCTPTGDVREVPLEAQQPAKNIHANPSVQGVIQQDGSFGPAAGAAATQRFEPYDPTQMPMVGNEQGGLGGP